MPPTAPAIERAPLRLMSGIGVLQIRPDTFRFTLMLGLLAALPSLSIDISAPTLLALQSQLAAPANLVGMTITLFMVGFAVGQFGAGPLSDRHGRRPILLLGLVGYTASAIGCSLAGSAVALVGWRLFQGVAAGACAVMAFAMIRDLFEGDQARAKRSYVTVVFGLAPMLAPSIGAWVLQQAGWRFIYIILACGGIALLLTVVVGIAESRNPGGATATPRGLASAYRGVLADRRFLGLACVNALSFGVIFAYIAGSPQVLMDTLALTPSGYGVVFAGTAAMLTTGAWISGRCARAGIGPATLLQMGLVFAALSACGLAVLLYLRESTLLTLLPLLLVNMACRGLIAPNAQHMALEPMRELAGTAAATIGVIQILTGALASAVVAVLLPIAGAAAMTIVMAFLALAALGVWLGLCRATPV